MGGDPSLSAPKLLGGGPDRLLEPSTPVQSWFTGVREEAVLVGENDDCLPKDDKQIADLACRLIIPVRIRPAPQAKKRAFA